MTAEPELPESSAHETDAPAPEAISSAPPAVQPGTSRAFVAIIEDFARLVRDGALAIARELWLRLLDRGKSRDEAKRRAVHFRASLAALERPILGGGLRRLYEGLRPEWRGAVLIELLLLGPVPEASPEDSGPTPFELWIVRLVEPLPKALNPARSVRRLARRLYGSGHGPGLGALPDAVLAQTVPHPFQEAFDASPSDSEIANKSLVTELLGRCGIALGLFTISFAVVWLCLASGLYRVSSPIPSENAPATLDRPASDKAQQQSPSQMKQ